MATLMAEVCPEDLIAFTADCLFFCESGYLFRLAVEKGYLPVVVDSKDPDRYAV